MAENDAAGVNNDDNWKNAVAMLTGYLLPDQANVLGSLVGNEGIPLMHVRLERIQNSKYYPGFASMGGWRKSNTDFVFPYFRYDTDGTRNPAEKQDWVSHYIANITFTRFASDAIPSGEDSYAQEKHTSKYLSDRGMFNKGHDDALYISYDTTALEQYVNGSYWALHKLVFDPYSTQGYEDRGISVPDDGYVDLRSFTEVAKAFDRAVKFLVDAADTMRTWDSKDIGKGSESWDGTGANIFKEFVHKLAKNYEEYADQVSGGEELYVPTPSIDGDIVGSAPARAIIELQNVLYTEAVNLHNAWASWRVESNPFRWLYDMLWDGFNTSLDIQHLQVDYQAEGGTTYVYATPGFQNTIKIYGKDYGPPNEASTWKLIGEDAVRKWQDSISSKLGTPAAQSIAAISKAMKNAADAFDQMNLKADNESLTTIAENEAAKKEKKDAKDAQNKLNNENKDLLNDQRRAQEAADADRRRAQEQADADRRRAQEEADKDRAQAEADRKKAEAQNEADRARAEADRKQQQADQKKAEAEARANQDKAAADAEADRKKAEAQNEADRARAEADRKQQQADQKKAEAEAKANQDKAAADAEADRKKAEAQNEADRAQAKNDAAGQAAAGARLAEQQRAEAKKDRAEQKAQEKKAAADAEAARKKAEAQNEADRARAEADRKQQQADQKKAEAEARANQDKAAADAEADRKKAEAQNEADRARAEADRKQQQADQKKAEAEARANQDKAAAHAEAARKKAEAEAKAEQNRAQAQVDQARQEASQSNSHASADAEQAKADAKADLQHQLDDARSHRDSAEQAADRKEAEAKREFEHRKAEAEAQRDQAEQQAASDRAEARRDIENQVASGQLSPQEGQQELHHRLDQINATEHDAKAHADAAEADAKKDYDHQRAQAQADRDHARADAEQARRDARATFDRRMGDIQADQDRAHGGGKNIEDLIRQRIADLPRPPDVSLPHAAANSPYAASFSDNLYNQDDMAAALGRGGTGDASDIGGPSSSHGGSPGMFPPQMRGMGGGESGAASGERTRNVLETGVTRPGRGINPKPTVEEEEHQIVPGGVQTASSNAPFMPPMGGGMPGGGEQKTQSDRVRNAWLAEDDDVWGAEEGGAPQALGR
ncbi:AAWKG family protein [Streptomyces sp. NPDC051636]|uniref:AAWKG family protein n=1 Tax=Streptomyces sp. NPDC051636 TaxID=3365663 RepID=UPI00378D4CB5